MQPSRVVTPEAVPLEFEVAGIGSRLLALLIDWTIQLAAIVGFLFAAGVVVRAAGGGDHGITAAFVYLLVFLLLFGYPVAMETGWRGRSVGKAVLGLRVVTREGAPVRFHHAAIRSALGLVDFFITGGAAAVLSVLFTRDSQRLGDLVAGTLVLRERTGMRKPSAVTFPVPPGLEEYTDTLDVAGLRDDEYTAVRSFLLRAPSLPPHVRADLALSLAGPVRDRLRTVPPDGVSPEVFLWCVAAARQQRHAPPPAAPSPIPSPIPTFGQFATPGGGEVTRSRSAPENGGGFVPPG